MGEDTQRMLKTAYKYSIAFAPINVSQELRERLSIWQHLGTEKQPPKNPRSRCLVKAHKSIKVKDMLRVTDRLKGEYERQIHFPVFSCHCKDCERDRENGCENPQRCAIEAQKHLGRITPKLNPIRPPNQDRLSLTKRRKERNELVAESDDEQGITFDPSVTEKRDLSDCFRIFVDP